MSKITIYSEACNKVAGFRAMGEEFIRKLVINSKSKSTHENYLRQMSKLALYYGRTPLELESDEIEEYLFHLVQRDTDSLSSYKHLVYGMRKLFQLFGKEELSLSLPSVSRPSKLPVVLSKGEVRRLLKAPRHIGHRVMFGPVYDTGIRINELTNLLISDVDLERRQIHVRQSKYKKDRYVTMSAHSVRGLGKHLVLDGPAVYMFESPSRRGMPIGKTHIRRMLKEAVGRAGIKKDVCVHTLRHTYATHQLEAGQNIMAVKEAMGHADIRATLVYLHIAQLDTARRFGCLDSLYPTCDG